MGGGSHIKVTLSIHMYGPTNVSNQLMWDIKSSTLNGAHCQGTCVENGQIYLWY